MQIPRAALNNWRALQEKIEFPKSVSLSLNPSDATKWHSERERNAANFGIGGVGAPTTEVLLSQPTFALILLLQKLLTDRKRYVPSPFQAPTLHYIK